MTPLLLADGRHVLPSGPVIYLPASFGVHDPLPVEFLKSPYPYFGGKAKIASEIWRRLGDVPNYVEPFFGGGSVLLKRPVEHPYLRRIETVNDKDGMISNFWRALQAEPDTVARFADWPVNENDLHARHYWLVQRKDSLQSQLEGDPDFYDAKIAGWWVWGMALWIGSGFCSGDGSWVSVDGELVKVDTSNAGVCGKLPRVSGSQGVASQRPHVGNAGVGVAAPSLDTAYAVQRKRPHLTNYQGVAAVEAGAGLRQLPPLADSGQGIARQVMRLSAASQGINRKMPSTGDASPGVARQLLSLGDAGRRVQRKRASLGSQGRGFVNQDAYDLYDYFDVLSARLRRVRVCSGDWTRVLGDSPTTKLGITAVVLDPPYTHEGRATDLYNVDHPDIAAQVRQWAIENGNDPFLRIVYCGYEDDFVWPDGWTSLKWTPGGGFDGQRKHGENNNRNREIIWFSPHCLKIDEPAQLSLPLPLALDAPATQPALWHEAQP